jgi:chromosome segregation ATPase
MNWFKITSAGCIKPLSGNKWFSLNFQANRIAYGAKRYRVVTLDGDLIEVSGAMSGGGKVKMSGKMGTQVGRKAQSYL